MATLEIPGDLLHTDDTSVSTHLKFNGIMVELLARIDTDLYRNYTTTYEKVFKIIYAECLKALYGKLGAALLFWVKLSTDIERWGFRMNQYDWCVMNKDTKG